MHLIINAVISFMLCNFVISFIIISSDAVYDNVAHITNNDILAAVRNNRILETVYRRQSLGKSHRFYFTAGERKEGDKHLDGIFKQTGWKNKINAVVNVTYPAADKNIKSLTFVMMVVYQESDLTRVNVVDGGIDKEKITISIHANATRYLSYNAQFFGFEQ